MAAETFVIDFKQPRLFRVGFATNPGKKLNPSDKPVGKRFMPGTNEITMQEWDAIKDHPAVKHLMDEGILAFVGPVPGEDKGTQEGESELQGLSVAEAKKVVKNTVKDSLLIKWKAMDKRPQVLSEIEKQLEKITLSDLDREKQ